MPEERALPITERALPESAGIAESTARGIVELMNAQDALVAAAVGATADSIAAVLEQVVERLRRGGRLVYVGAGSSGRLGVLDAAECPPTFGIEVGRVVAVMAGGDDAVRSAREGAEDSTEDAVHDLRELELRPADAVVGISASGRTPYTCAAVRYAREIGAFTAALCCNPGTELAAAAQCAMEVVVGPEVLAGSTRLKAGTATKMVLNMLSTGAMVMLGHTAGNRMADLRAHSAKLRERAVRIVAETTGLGAQRAAELLAASGGSARAALDAAAARDPRSHGGQRIYHLTTPAAWRSLGTAAIAPRSLAEEGFVHCSYAGQIVATAARHFAAEPRLILLGLDRSRLGAALREEDTSGHGVFPHVYAPILPEAIVHVATLSRGANGRFVLPRGLEAHSAR